MKRIIFAMLTLLVACIALGQTAGEKEKAMRDAGLEPYGNESIASSTFVVSSMVKTGNMVDLAVVVTNNSGDLEWMDKVTVEFPAGWSIIGMGYNDLGGEASVPIMSGTGTATATWTDSGAPCSGLGFIYSSGAQLELLVAVDVGAAVGLFNIPWMFEGDTYGSDPHVLCSSTSSCGYDPCYGAINPAPTTDLALDLSAGPASSEVPTLGQWGMIIFVSMLGLIALVTMRRRGTA